MIGSLGIIFSVAGVLGGLFPSTTDIIIEPASMSDIRAVKSEVVSIKNDLLSVKAQLDKVSMLPKETALALKIEELNSTLLVLRSQVSKLNEAIIEDPEKALSAVLLRKELDTMKSDYNNSISLVRQQIENVSDLGKWLVGILLALSVSILAVAIGGIVQRRAS